MMIMMMMMMRRFVERVLNSPQTRCQSQSNRWVLKCQANARGVSSVVQRAAGRLFQMCGLATAKLLICSVVVLGKNSVPVSADRDVACGYGTNTQAYLVNGTDTQIATLFYAYPL